MQLIHAFIKTHSQLMAAFWSVLIVLIEASIALYILRNV
ncbi:hypothetical protein NT01EI_1420 [Edwardsiella ictaluri 93-146]|uniref:Uncharacterized protein n=1 Tax=Edwardsiella ictaluri (strain 93-146) TaxID=634503 RepID=C5BDR1_EDWI9|nr:hypothetical protein NT01EI_1420 [Edwardsiella ictaluri 93-146]STP88198.1 Uncharacterised protein [Edwardsiella ictaluri]